MPDESRPGDLPPDLPPEYAEAYRRAYERAYREAAGADDTGAFDPVQPDSDAGPDDAAEDEAGEDEAGRDAAPQDEPPQTEPPQSAAPQPEVSDSEATQRIAVTGPLFADEPTDQRAEPPAARTADRPADRPAGRRAEDDAERTQMLGGFTITREPEVGADEAAYRASRERPAWLVPALLGGAAVLLILTAYGVGRLFSSSVPNGGSDQTGNPNLGLGAHAPKGNPYSGAVEAVRIKSASATCQEPEGVDAAGHPISYRPRNAADGDLSTAWRCYGDGVGEKLTLNLPDGAQVAEIGLVPGYAKTDPSSGADRYAENNRVTKVRWRFSDGTSVEQKFDGSANNRDMQTVRIPPTKTDSVVIEILATTRGPRNTTAISEVRIAAPAH